MVDSGKLDRHESTLQLLILHFLLSFCLPLVFFGVEKLALDVPVVLSTDLVTIVGVKPNEVLPAAMAGVLTLRLHPKEAMIVSDV